MTTPTNRKQVFKHFMGSYYCRTTKNQRKSFFPSKYRNLLSQRLKFTETYFTTWPNIAVKLVHELTEAASTVSKSETTIASI